MVYIQLVDPNIDISARAGMCLEYVDNAVNAPKRTATAQIAYETVNDKGWVSANSEYPRNVWFVLFWSIDNNDYAGLGHVALAFVSDDGNMQIHDSEVHRGARRPYTSLDELAGWFGSVGTRLTYLGWSIGVDGIQIVGNIGQDEQKQLGKIANGGQQNNDNSKDELKKEIDMTDGIFKFEENFDGYFKDDHVYWSSVTGFKYLSNTDHIKVLQLFNPSIKVLSTSKGAPWSSRASQINGTNYGKR